MNRDEIMQLTLEGLRLEIAKAQDIGKSPHIFTVTGDGPDGYWGTYCPGCKRWISDDDKLCIPNWPGDIAAAWELVEEMAYREHVTLDSQGPTWTIDVDDYVRTIQIEADTAPLAICRAWLMWKESQ